MPHGHTAPYLKSVSFHDERYGGFGPELIVHGSAKKVWSGQNLPLGQRPTPRGVD